ncbi:hypothetical protein PYW07_010580 [Mythimna separata]|uniref:IMD domain-containing protein n=1 Tax=Mythimna separata TaxID=271217 RepID=A0AAD7YAE2_MYTSE|nr:hypothetical protein PYW07_010580 [Mythimna separata]
MNLEYLIPSQQHYTSKNENAKKKSSIEKERDNDRTNSAPMWEEFISKATKLHSALKSALVAIAAFLDAFQKIADAATNARDPNQLRGLEIFTSLVLEYRAG